jgi:hypothetical protein
MLTLEDTCQTYSLAQSGERMATMLFELVYDAVEQALAPRGELHRFRTPVLLKDCDAEFYMQHSVSGVMAALMQEPDALAIVEWLEQDDVVRRHAEHHPEVREQLAVLRQMAEEASMLEMPLCELSVGERCITFR